MFVMCQSDGALPPTETEFGRESPQPEPTVEETVKPEPHTQPSDVGGGDTGLPSPCEGGEVRGGEEPGEGVASPAHTAPASPAPASESEVAGQPPGSEDPLEPPQQAVVPVGLGQEDGVGQQASPAGSLQSPAHSGPLNLHQSPAHPDPSPPHSFHRPPAYPGAGGPPGYPQYPPPYNHHYFNNANNNYNGQTSFMSGHGFPPYSGPEPGRPPAMPEQHEIYMNQSRAHESASHHSSHIKPEFGQHPGLGGHHPMFPRLPGHHADPYSFGNSDDELCSPGPRPAPAFPLGFSGMPMPLLAPKVKKPRKPRKPRSPKPPELSSQASQDSRR